ncbi:hypothetical protein BDV28DRAFT_150209 [Aspergillus coremiiformis]|uniref:Uncharacterized protein n=1 Tax=Aspergillus coremiiformis TaxID=138285 RepID=A0A5N6Z0K8_9EURO|nr:hypothetical protein BDV28DRAFT_150209 [Aspergillus coremiiformis]
MSSDGNDAKPAKKRKDEDHFKYNPELNYPMVKLADLPEPPRNWCVCGRTAEDASKARKANAEKARRWVRFHSWGIDLGVKGDLTTLRSFKVLWKLFYYQQDKHRPQNFEQIDDVDRDAGPRLLQCSLGVPDLLPISRFYPHPPPATRLPGEEFHRPSDALYSRPDSYIEQMLYPSFGEPKEVNNVLEEIVPSDASARASGTGASNQHQLRLPKVMARSVMEAMERVVMQFAYENLARHHSAVGQDGQVYLTATTDEDLRQANIGSFPAISHLKLAVDPDNIDRLIFSADGDKYPYRGRGPEYRNNSSGIDSIIVVGKLLDAGSTVLDRKDPEWRERFTNVQKAFIEATNVNWDLCSKGDSRDRFWAVMAAEDKDNGIGVGLQSPLLKMWMISTDLFGQFIFKFDEQATFCATCNPDTATANATYHTTIVMPPTCPEDRKGVSMQQLISRSFASEYTTRCGQCQERVVTYRRKLRGLPMRLVVTLDGSVPVKKHTRDISFDYITDEGQRGTAAYRWLGGIYCKDNHCRVYWSDNQRGEADTGEIQVYDSAMLSGVIAGGIAQAHRDDKVPEAWWKNKPVPLLVYERIINPDDEVVNVALHTLGDMVKVRNQQKLLLQGHISWTPSETPRARVGFPWRRLIDRKEARYHLAQGAYDPESHGQTLHRSSGADRHASTPGRASIGSSRMNVNYLTSPLPGLAPQAAVAPTTASLFDAPTLSMFQEISPLLAHCEPPIFPGLEHSTQDNAPYGTLSSTHSSSQLGQYNGQSSNTQVNAQYLGHHNPQYNPRPYLDQYSTQHATPSNGHHRAQPSDHYGIQPSTQHPEPSIQLSTPLTVQNSMPNEIPDDWIPEGLDFNTLDIFGVTESIPSIRITPTPNPATSTNNAPTHLENNSYYPHQSDDHEGLYINPAVLTSNPLSLQSVPQMPLDNRRTQSHLDPPPDARWPGLGSVYGTDPSLPGNQIPSRNLKRKRVDEP